MRACSTSALQQGTPAWLEEPFCVDEDGNGTVVDQLDGHVGPELAIGPVSYTHLDVYKRQI